ncbi:MAG: hypothetical protein ACFFDK_10165 [Promethearchaeota archaeon]
MSKDKTNKPRLSYRELQEKIEEFKNKRDDLNKKTKDYINNLQEIESEINNALKTARDVYKKKRDYWNGKVKLLKKKKIEYKNILDKLIEEKRKLQKERSSNNRLKSFISIKQIDRKIENLERIIETENLDITKENEIVDKIKELAENKQEQLIAQQNDGSYKIERQIEIVKINLNKIYEQLNKWSNKSQKNHAKMQDLYQKANELKNNKKQMEEELIENKKIADQYHFQYLDVMSQKKKMDKGRRPYRQKGAKYPPRKQKPKHRPPSKDKELIEKIKQDKLATALEKQKAGKKLNLFEARLILEQNKS